MNTDCQCVIFSNEAYNAIIDESFDKDPNETGGILLGHILDNGMWIVIKVLPPGERSIFQHAYFEYDEQYVNYAAQTEAYKYEHELILLGLWHRHPGSMDTFSRTDDGTNRTFAALNPKGAISGLVNIDPRFRLTMYHVSTSSRYSKIDIEVGDDLIPEEYFKLKHYPSKGLNPEPPKNRKTGTGMDYTINQGNSNHNSRKSGLSGLLETKYLFLLIFVVGLGMSLFSHYSYEQLKGTDDIKSLHKVFYSEYPLEIQPIADSVAKAAAKEFDETATELQKQLNYKDVLFKQNKAEYDTFITKNLKPNISLNKLERLFKDALFSKDSINLENFINEYLTEKFIAREDANIDSLKAVYELPLINKELAERKQEFIDGKVNKLKKRMDANLKVSRAIALLWIITFLSLIIAFISRRNKLLVERLIVAGLLLISTFVVSLFSGCFSSVSFLSIPLFHNYLIPFSLFYFIGIASVFAILSFLTFFVLWFLDTFQINPKKIASQTGFWYQQKPQLYLEEENEIKRQFANAEKNVENGVVSFYINTGKKIDGQQEPLSFQLVYSSDYLKNKEIKIYLVNPDLVDLLGDKIKDFPHIAIDSSGESYLDLSKTIKKDKVSGIEVIRKLHEWIQRYGEWQANRINMKDIKL